MRSSRFSFSLTLLRSSLLALFLLGLSLVQAQHTTSMHSIVHVPLVSHSTVLERRRRRRRLVSGDTNNDKQPPRPGYSKYDPRSLQQQETNTATQVAGLYQGYGTHYADLWVGTPHPQRQTVIIDTGSSAIAFPCQGCNNCGAVTYHTDDLFFPDNSTTFRHLSCSECLKGACHQSQCQMSASYREGSSWNAVESVDTTYIGGLHSQAPPDNQHADDLDPYHAPAYAFDLKFGCQSSVKKLFVTQLADGICGMDQDSASLWWQMFDSGMLTKKSFALCFARYDIVDRLGTEAGALSLGGIDSRLPSTPMVYTVPPSSTRRGFYDVTVRNMYLRAGGGGTSATSTDPNLSVIKLDVSSYGNVIVDSGTTDTYFSRGLAAEFGRQYKILTGKSYSHSPRHFTAEELAMEPTILIQLAGDDALNAKVAENSPGLAGSLDPDHPLDVVLAIPPEHYYEYDDDDDVQAYVSRFYLDESSGGVLGANAMMGHNVLFDVDSNRLGWAESDCNYTAITRDFISGGEGPGEPTTDAPASTTTAAPMATPGTSAPTATTPAITPGTSAPVADHGLPHGPTETSTYNDDPGDEPGDEPSGTYEDVTKKGICTGVSCQMSVLGLVILFVLVGTVKLVRRASAGPKYDLAMSELELQEQNGEFVTADVEFA